MMDNCVNGGEGGGKNEKETEKVMAKNSKNS